MTQGSQKENQREAGTSPVSSGLLYGHRTLTAVPLWNMAESSGKEVLFSGDSASWQCLRDHRVMRLMHAHLCWEAETNCSVCLSLFSLPVEYTLGNIHSHPAYPWDASSHYSSQILGIICPQVSQNCTVPNLQMVLVILSGDRTSLWVPRIHCEV